MVSLVLPSGRYINAGIAPRRSKRVWILTADLVDRNKAQGKRLMRRLPFFGNKMKIEASVLLGDRDEEVEVHGEPDCWDFGRGRRRVAGGRDLQEAWHQ